VKIVFIGAGSVVFGRNVLADILWHPALKEADLVLVDIDAERLSTAERMTHIVNEQLGAGARITATKNRRLALEGADFVINAIGVGGHAAAKIDLELPARFGVRQIVGDTLGVGGIFRAVRSVPELLAICSDMEELCPRALLLNCSNPMAMHCLAVERTTKVRHVGLCHGVQNTAQTMRLIIAMAQEPAAAVRRHFQRPWNSPERVREWQAWLKKSFDPGLSYTCAGINHMGFFLRFRSKGRDLYPLLWKAMDIPHIWRFDPVRFELFKRFGYFMTETSGHMAEYVPYFLKNEREIRRCCLRPAVYLETCRRQDKEYCNLRRLMKSGQPIVPMPYEPSVEYAARIINASVENVPYVFNGNVHNEGGRWLPNLPGDCCVEVPCVVDKKGPRPLAPIDLPPQCAALIRTNVNVQDLAVRGILEGDRRYIHQAIMLDPNTASSLTLPEIDRVVEAMFKAHAKRLPRNLR